MFNSYSPVRFNPAPMHSYTPSQMSMQTPVAMPIFRPPIPTTPIFTHSVTSTMRHNYLQTFSSPSSGFQPSFTTFQPYTPSYSSRYEYPMRNDNNHETSTTSDTSAFGTAVAIAAYAICISMPLLICLYIPLLASSLSHYNSCYIDCHCYICNVSSNTYKN